MCGMADFPFAAADGVGRHPERLAFSPGGTVDADVIVSVHCRSRFYQGAATVVYVATKSRPQPCLLIIANNDVVGICQSLDCGRTVGSAGEKDKFADGEAVLFHVDTMVADKLIAPHPT